MKKNSDQLTMPHHFFRKIALKIKQSWGNPTAANNLKYSKIRDIARKVIRKEKNDKRTKWEKFEMLSTVQSFQ